ncbi:MAG: gliding motility-associated C-terminal domain-containing protein [Chitinophagaceae bacterium]|nr:gliding motility-associated C-terminal domain-containing protein [Chitinophagaceae bacterium]
MKTTRPLSLAGVILLILFCSYAKAQSFGTVATAVSISDCNQTAFFNTSGNVADHIGPSSNVFDNANFGVHTQNSGTLVFRGAQVKTFKNPASSNVCNVRIFYRVYLQSGAPGAFTSVDLPWLEDCNVPGGVFPSGGPCQAGDQKWQRITSNINLTTFPAGNYVLEVYYEASGSQTSTSLCNDLVTLNNGGVNYKGFFSIQSPNLSSTNPSSCFGNEGSITIGGLVPNTTYQLSYNDDGTPVGPITVTTNGAGQIVLNAMNKGFYSNFSLQINGCTTNLFTGIILSDPIFVPTFTAIPPFCAGTPAPVLQPVSNNGMTGAWSPATVSNTATGNYTFTPDPNQCGFPVTITITVIPRATPTFPFGTSLIICQNGSVPTLPNTSTNGFNGTWSPAIVDNQNSGSYTFTPNAGLCANPTTFNVTVNPNIPPTFTFGTSLTICAGGGVPALPTTSTNNISGTWSPSVVDNQNSATYTFTPNPGQCGTVVTFDVTVNPNAIPVFPFGNSLTICSAGSVPALPSTSTNGINGSWSPATVNNLASGSYTFTPDPGICALPFTFSVTVNPNLPPTFPFGTSATICAGGSVPILSNTSTNAITGTWSPSIVDNQNSATYTFTPDAGQCATGTTFAVTIAPNIPPTFSFGTTLTICAGGSVPALPTTSTNGITGTWSPSIVDNQNSGSYIFTPTSGLCATTASFTVTVNPNATPVFSFGTSLTICAGGSVPTLPNTSDNAITGTWSPSVVNNMTSGSYTFTPTAGLCALPVTFTVTVSPNIPPTFAFGTSLTICAGGSVPTLPNTSTNGITGTWSPSVVNDQASGSYTFTPDAGPCATGATFTVTVNPNIPPTFAFGTTLTICENGSVPALPTTSSNGITGTWSPAVVDNQNSGNYTFTPTAGLCATSASFTVTVNPNVTPLFSFGSSLTICAGATAPTLPGTSTNGVTGTWSPAVANNQATGTYTFTPTAGLCAVPTTFTITVNPNIPPTFSFGTSLTICAGGIVPALPGTANNGITGTWSPAIVDNQNSGTYIFTPTAGLCALSHTFTVTVNPNVLPVFTFGTSMTICEGNTAPVLPTTSTNGITGTWSPAIVDNQNSGTYTFTQTAGQCATGTTFTVTVNPNIPPTFSFGPTLTICAGATVPTLPTVSDNGITGTWSPAVVDNQASGTYVFTPAGGCATTSTFTVTVNPNIAPTFSFGSTLTICAGGTVPALPGTSSNGIAGSWSPAVVDDQGSGTYTFTPTTGLCALSFVFNVTVNPNVTPVFSFGPNQTICAGATAPVLPTTSSNGITGAWSPAVVDNQNSGTYTFTPNPGECVLPGAVTLTVTVTPNIVPVFSFGTTLSICTGDAVPSLPTTSDNGLDGTWSPAAVSNQASGVYTFTPAPGQCVTSYTFTVTVRAIVTPTFSFGTFQSVCMGSTAPVLANTSTNGITGTWSPSVIDNQVSGTYTFTADAGQCALNTSLEYEVNAIPTVSLRTDTTVYDGAIVPAFDFVSSPGASITWVNSNTAIGLAASGSRTVPSFTAINTGIDPVIAEVTATPTMGGCVGLLQKYTITVLPLNKDVFVPNVFTPNKDGKNDRLLVYGNYITKIDMRVFNQWGQQIAVVTDKNTGWDGTHKGNPQPVGVYVYVLKAELSGGRIVNLKGSITLIR